MKSIIEIKGHIIERVDGIIINEQHNSIHADMREQIAIEMRDPGVSAGWGIDTPEMFTEDNAQIGNPGSQANLSGICVRDSNAPIGDGYYFSMVTEIVSLSATHTTWRGTMLSNANRSIAHLAIGRSWITEATGLLNKPFTVVFATVNRDTTLNLVNGQLYTVDWTISV